MKIYNKSPILVLFDIVKALTSIPIYKEVMTEDENSTPNSYILLRSGIVDNGKIYGDGITGVRNCECDIILISKGSHPNTSDLHNTNSALIVNKLKESNVPYSFVNIGYNESSNTTTSTWIVNIKYV